MVEVAAAVIERADGAFLLAQRPPGKPYAGWWEFPGGKVHAGESAAAALARELHEELGIEVRRAYPWITREHTYEHATVRLNFFRVVAWADEPRAREGQAMRWQRLDAPMPEPMLPANAPVLASLALPLEYAITDARSLGTEAMRRHLERRLAGGLRLLQVRDKDMAPDERAAFAAWAVQLAHRHGARALVNSDAALGAAVGADGVHFTAAQLAQMEERPQGVVVAASCHTRDELARAMRLGMDLAVLGPVRQTATHADAAALGWQAFARIAHGASIPVYAIGGLRGDDLDAARAAGAHGLAMIRGSWSG